MLEVAMPQSNSGSNSGSSAASFAAPATLPPPAESHPTFREVLSDLNPLQYLPVIGTIYRAATGDQIPEPLRRFGSLVASFLMGGPIGALANIAVTAAEKLTGFDLDKAGQAMLHGQPPAGGPGDAPPQIAGPTTPPPPASAASPPASSEIRSSPVDTAASPTSPAAPAEASPTAPALPEAWSPAQLAAYGVDTAPDGTLKLADLRGAEVLNSLELSRIQMVQTAYSRTTSLTD